MEPVFTDPFSAELDSRGLGCMPLSLIKFSALIIDRLIKKYKTQVNVCFTKFFSTKKFLGFNKPQLLIGKKLNKL